MFNYLKSDKKFSIQGCYDPANKIIYGKRFGSQYKTTPSDLIEIFEKANNFDKRNEH